MITPKQQQIFTQSSQSGFTIIESLMAVVVVSILMAAIAPAIALSVATRVQAKRVEQASQAARAYVDGVKAGTIIAPTHTVTLSEVNATTKVFTSARSTFAAIAAPTSTGSFTCTSPTTSPVTTTNYYCTENTTTSSLYCINGDETAGCSSNSVRDLIIQSFRTTNDKNYLLGVRVYRAEGFKTSDVFTAGGQQATFTGGLGKLKAPLLQMTTEITVTQPGYQDYCDRLGGCT
ncbi:hormogonium polysaccharide secretion pseudopilin HpsB [Chlorogloea sp. CCALA 695]|uniref:hormogonium polysaccharide secretion pseudopilin HpsB n=1 Tax=Chlorogloea sp. CCALA 695 TaxID=2107693 RepID=UPI000D0825E9|nr:hormogonium polysaccharide secretion pseudopilin HpsB [Chlorogloea sp. CCALA 695]PSB34515.1 prepilin-type cleavage/methylation domain-containing protein [Chlorogloea sp. CCALA 695]